MSSETTGVQGNIKPGEAVDNAYMEALAKKKANPKLDKDAFLNLLMAQLKYQDPMDPMDNTQMVAQLAQFSALEQMTNISTVMTNASAYNLIGKQVYAESYNESTFTTDVVEGVVESVTMKNGNAQLVIGDKTVDYNDVKKVYDASDYSQIMNGNMVNSQAISLVGKTVQAVTSDEDGNIGEYIEGKVDYVTFLNDEPILHIGGKEVVMTDVMTVGEGNMIIGNNVTYPNGEEDSSGQVSEIKIIDDKIYMVVDGIQVEIADLSSVMTAFSLIGKSLDLGEVSGKITGVSIRDKVPYVQVGDAEVKYSTAAKSAV